MRSPRRLVVLASSAGALLALSSCIGGSGGLPLGSRCEAGGCEGSLVCRYGRCRAACTFDRDCGDGRACVAVAGSPGERVCTERDEAGCDPADGASCPEGLLCDPDELLCRSPCGTGCGDGRECREGLCVDAGTCTRDGHCRLGCRCEGQACLPVQGLDAPEGYCAEGPDPLELGDDDPATLVVDTSADERACPAGSTTCDPRSDTGSLSLREALLLAASAGPCRIRFSEARSWAEAPIEVTGEALPPVPSLTLVDGEVPSGPVTLSGRGLDAAGLTVDGRGVAVSDLVAVGFGGPGFLVASGSSAVHLFRVRAGSVVAGNGGAGVEVEPGCVGVWISRGRELRGLEPRSSPVRSAFPSDCRGVFDAFDVNVALGNGGPGIAVRGAVEVQVSGTWVGFDPADPGVEGCAGCGNGGPGLEVVDSDQVRIGAFDLLADEARGLESHVGAMLDGSDPVEGLDPFPGFVMVGNNAGPGISVRGGSELHLAGLWVGATSCPPYWGQNGGGLALASTEGRVVVGPEAAGPAVERPLFSFVVSSGPALVAEDPAGPVTIRNLHAGSFDEPPFAVEVSRARSTVAVHHGSISGAYSRAAVGFLDPGAGASLELLSSMFWRSEPLDAPVLEVEGDLPARVAGCVQYGFGPFCRGACEVDEATCEAEPPWPASCRSRVMYPLSPDCPQVDRALETGFDRTVDPATTHHGCGPDVGAFECSSPACRAASCG